MGRVYDEFQVRVAVDAEVADKLQELGRPVALDLFTHRTGLGQVVLVDSLSGATLAGGVVEEVSATSKSEAGRVVRLTRDMLADDLRCLANGEPIYKQEYTFNQPGVEPKWLEVRPAPVILVEGLFVFHHAPVRELFDLKVFVEASEDVQLQRRLARDAAERGYSPDDVRYQWDNHVMPAYRDYLLPYRSRCDLHVINEERFDKAVHVLRDHLMQLTSVKALVEVA